MCAESAQAWDRELVEASVGTAALQFHSLFAGRFFRLGGLSWSIGATNRKSTTRSSFNFLLDRLVEGHNALCVSARCSIGFEVYWAVLKVLDLDEMDVTLKYAKIFGSVLSSVEKHVRGLKHVGFTGCQERLQIAYTEGSTRILETTDCWNLGNWAKGIWLFTTCWNKKKTACPSPVHTDAWNTDLSHFNATPPPKRPDTLNRNSRHRDARAQAVLLGRGRTSQGMDKTADAFGCSSLAFITCLALKIWGKECLFFLVLKISQLLSWNTLEIEKDKDVIVPYLANLFQVALSMKCIPTYWWKAKISPLWIRKRL